MIFELVCSTFLAAARVPSVGAGGVEEVKAALRTLRDAHDANEERYPNGRMRVRLTTEHSNSADANLDSREAVDAIVTWSGDRVRTDFMKWQSSGARKLDTSRPSPDRGISIYDDKEIVMYRYNGRLFITPVLGNPVMPEHRLDPRRRWYLSQINEDVPCVRFLEDILKNAEGSPHARFSCESDGQESVHISIHDEQDGSSMDAWYSYLLDGNLTRFELNSARTRVKDRAEYRWERDRKGRVYLARSEQVASYPVKDAPGRYVSLERLEVSEFDPDYVPAPRMFELSSLELVKGTLVEDKVRGRTYRTGDRPIPTVADSLEELIREMKARGFAGSGRD